MVECQCQATDSPQGGRTGSMTVKVGAVGRYPDHGSGIQQLWTTSWGRLLVGLPGAVSQRSPLGVGWLCGSGGMMLALGSREGGQEDCWPQALTKHRALRAAVSHWFRFSCYPGSVGGWEGDLREATGKVVLGRFHGQWKKKTEAGMMTP